MNVLVMYDSEYGNTEKIAYAINEGVRAVCQVSVSAIRELQSDDVQSADLLIMGSPTQAGRHTKGMQAFVEGLQNAVLKDKPVAVFDTRFDIQRQKWGVRLLMRVIGYAAGSLAQAMGKKGARIIGEPGAFIVGDIEGPLRDGELDRAREWGKNIAAAAGKL